ELIAYNITVTPQPPEQFFRQSPGPLLAGVDPSLVDASLDDENVSYATLEYLGHLDLASHATQESFIDPFARETLHILVFVERGLIFNTHHSIPLSICGDDCRVAQTDQYVCSIGADKTVFNASHPEPQVIADAIAAYRYNNEKRLLR
ncbi:hypothetical protein EV702DRAFT_931536, partial [Suillus placidus]